MRNYDLAMVSVNLLFPSFPSFQFLIFFSIPYFLFFLWGCWVILVLAVTSISHFLLDSLVGFKHSWGLLCTYKITGGEGIDKMGAFSYGVLGKIIAAGSVIHIYIIGWGRSSHSFW